MTSWVSNYLLSYRPLHNLASCHRPVIGPQVLWYAGASNPAARRQRLQEISDARLEMANTVFTELRYLMPPEAVVEPVFQFIKDSSETDIFSNFHGQESILAARAGFVLGHLDPERVGEQPPVGLVLLTECIHELVPLFKSRFPASLRLHIYAAYSMVRMGLI